MMNKNISISLLLTFYLLLPSFLLTLSLPALAGMSFVERLQNGQGQVEGLDGASLVAVSHDGKFVYVASSEDKLTVLIRNPATGEVAPIHSVSVSDARSITMSADDQFIYSVGSEGLMVFKRDPNTGQLSLQQTINHGAAEIHGDIRSVMVSADNQSVYVGGWDTLVVFKRDPSTEQLISKQILINGPNGVDGLWDTRSVTVSSDNQFVYVLGGDTLAVFKRDPITEQLTFQQILKNGQDGVDGLGDARSVTVSPDNQFVYVLDGDTLAVFEHDPGTEQLTFKQILKNGQDGVEGLGDARSVTVSADNQFVYVASYGDNAVVTFARDSSTGQLSFQQVLKNGETGVKGLEGANSVSASVDNQWVYVASILSNAVAVLARDLSTGQLTLRQILKDGQSQVKGLDGARSVAISADDQFVYVASGEDDAVVTFARDKDTGQLTLQQVLKDGQAGVDGLVGARAITVSADDQFVYVVSHGDKALVVFARDRNTGQLSFQQVLKNGQNGVEGLANARSVTASADNLSVYVTPDESDPVAVVTFKRDPSTGQLSLQQVLKTEQLGMENSLVNVSPIVISADNRFVYMTAYNQSSDSVVAIFARDLSTGELTLQQILKNGQDGVEWLEKPYLITVSADDQFVYVLGEQQWAVLARDLSTGELRFQQAQGYYYDEHGYGYCDYYSDSIPTSVAVSADNLWVYVGCGSKDSVDVGGAGVFIRDPSTGQLTLLQDSWYFYNSDWLWGRGSPPSIAVSHDSRFVYFTSAADTITVYTQFNSRPENYIYYYYDNIIFNENTSFTFKSEYGYINDSDAGNFPLQVTLTVTNGTLTLNGKEGLSFTEGDGTADSRLVFTGTLAAINNALIGMTFTPTLNFYGEATLNIVTDDLGHTGYGGAQQDADTLIIKVLDVNEPPVMETIATQYGIPNKLLSFKVIATDPNVPKQNLTYKLINKDLPPGASIDSETGQFKWTPLPTQVGIFKLTVAVTDNGVNPDNLEASQTFEVIISDTPILKPIGAQTVLVDNTLTFTAQADFLETQALTFSLTNAPPGAKIDKKTGVFTWTPTQTGKFPVTVVVTEPFGQRTAEEKVIITVTQVSTSLELTLNSVAIFQNGHLTAKGKLTSYPQQPAGLKELPIQLQITAPDGSITTQEVTTIASGEYHSTQLPAFTQTGQYQLQAQFANDDRLAASQSEPQTVLVSALAGHALLVQGRDAKGNGQEAYGKSLNRVYQKLINRGFIDDNIDYLGYDQNQVGVLVDDTPDKAKIQTALKTLPTRLNADPAPLYIVMVDHGDLEGNFHLDNGNHEEIAPTELDNWLTALEQGLNAEAKKQPRVIIIGSCYSGNFIPALSKPGRILVTSTAPGEESYKGPKEPDEVRSGEYFIEALFAQLGQGYSLKAAFELARQSTELFTRADDTDFFNEQFQDNAVQHPLLDDNSDNQGSNVLGVDGQTAKTIYLGLGAQYDPTAPDSPAVILSVTPTVHLEANTTSAPLWARVNQPSRVKGEQVFVDIRPPSLQLTNNGIEQRETLAMEGLERIELGLASDSEFSGHFDDFTQIGRYELFYFVVDSETGDRSPLQRSLVYKDRAGNQPPTPVQLRAPQNGDETHTTVIFAWQPSPDPDNDPVTYTFLVATEPTMQQIIYRQEELRTAMTYLNSESVIADPLNQGQPGLRDGTKYAWQVQAVDKYGAMAESPVFTFQTNDTNLPPGLGSLYVYNAVDFVSLENATLDFWVVDELGNLVLDTNGLPIPAPQPPEVFQDQGFYNLTLPYGRRRATLRSEGYQEQEVLIDTTDGLAHLRVAMTPAGSISIPGQLKFAVEQARIEETRGEIALIVKRVGGDDGVVSVAYQLLPDGSASPESDYSVQEGQLTWADQDGLPKKILVTLHNDNQKEGDETFALQLNNPSGGATLGTPSTINITLLDNEVTPVLQPGMLQFQAPTYSATEGTVLPAILVNRLQGSNGIVTVQYSITPQSTATAGDYTGGTGILEWADGDTEPKPLQLTLIDDSEAEAVEIIQLILFNPTGGVQLGEPIQTTLTIADNEITTQSGENTVIVPPQPGDTTPPKTDPPKTDTPPVMEPSESQAGVLQFLAPTYSLNEGIGSVSAFTVTRSGGSQGAVLVEYTTLGGTAEIGIDYVGGTGLLVWADGDDMPKAIELKVLNDPETEKAETIQLQLANPTGGATLGLYRQATLIIADDDTAAAQSPNEEPASIEFTSPLYWAQEEEQLAELTVLRTGNSQGEISVQYVTTTNSSATLGDDYLEGSGTLVWADQETQPKTITLNLIDDQLPDEEIIHLLLVKPTGQARLGKQSEAAVIIKDNDKSVVASPAPAVLQFTQTFATVPEDQGYILISIIRTGNHQEPITVDYETISETATAHEDYLPSQGRLSWDEGEQGMISLIIPILKDNQVEPDETFVIRLFNPSTAAQLGPLSQMTIQIQDQESSTDTQLSPLLPNLGRGMALVKSTSTQWKTSLNCQAFPCPLQAAFRGGSSLNGLSYYPQSTLSPYQYVNIRGEIDVAAEHVGQSAELLVVAAWKPLDSTEPERYFMQDNQGQILPWDLNLAHLVAAQSAVTLTPTQEIHLYTGFLGSGQIQLFFGYQLLDGVIVFNGEQAVELVVKALAED